MKAKEPVLREYQRNGIRHLLGHANACLFQCPGLGKTLQVLLAFVLVKQRKPKFKMLIVAPLKVAQTVWRQEAEKWAPTKELNIVLLHGKSRTLEYVYKDHDIAIINYEGLMWLEGIMGNRPWPWQMIVYDELTKCKSVGTQRGKWIKRNYYRFLSHWGLTGTPMSTKGYLDLFGQIRAIDDGRALGNSKNNYEYKYFYYASAFDKTPRIKKGAGELITKRISPLVYQLTAEDHLKMPDKLTIYHDIPMSSSHMEVYQALERQMVLEYAGEEVTAVTAGVLWGKLLQVLQGFNYADGTKNEIWHNTDKIDALMDIIEEAAGEQVLVFYKFKAEGKKLQELIPEGTLMTRKNTDECVERWNSGEIRTMFANPLSAGHGLNLQLGGAHIMVWLCQDGSPEIYQQAVGRLYRQGQKNETVVIHHLNMVAPDETTTIDDDILSMLKNRTTVQQAMIKRLAFLQAQRLASGDGRKSA